MYRPTSRQRPLLGAPSRLPPEARARLARTWAGSFQEKVLPLLLSTEGDFADLYCADNGRPNWSIALRLGICLLQEAQDLTDQEVLDAFAFDVRFQFALDVDPSQAYLSRRSLGDFRSRMVRADPEMTRLRRLFDAIAIAAIDDLNLSVATQRLDSTQVVSNIRTRGRVDLFSKTLRQFLRVLLLSRAEEHATLPTALLQWEARDESAGFGKGRPATALQCLAEWAVELVRRFEGDDDIASWESWELVRRLVDEHCIVEDPTEDEGGSEGSAAADKATDEQDPVVVTLRAKPANPGNSLQSPYDPDATYGHKGVGYCVQITETTQNQATEVLTDFAVQPAANNDWGETGPVLQRLEDNGLKPSVLAADAGYPHVPALEDADKRGVELLSPVSSGTLPDDFVGRERFDFDEAGEVVRCPEGVAPIRHGYRKQNGAAERTLHAYFDRQACLDCPLLGRCVARGRKTGAFTVEVTRGLRLRDEAIAHQRDNPEWWERYKIRSGIEATNSELKRKHGLGHLRVRRAPRVRLAVTLKLAACNVKRWLRASRAQ